MRVELATIEHMTEIKAHWRAHSDTLGFLPNGAFDEHLSRKEILVALDEAAGVAGYLLFRKGTEKASIVHLCVAEAARGRGIAQGLVHELSRRTKHLHGIDLHCRRDFEADKVWPRLGFCARGEKPGRSSAGSTLTHWWLDHGIPHLFSNLRAREETSIRVVIDANIFFDLAQTPPRDESAALLADWLQIELCVTEEMNNEIHRQEDRTLREQNRLFMSRFPVVQTLPDRFDEIRTRLAELIPPSPGTSDESDLRQLARTIGAEIAFFVTRDQRLLDAAVQIYDTFQLTILRPAELISRFDELRRELEYQPIRFSGTRLSIRLAHADDCEDLVIFQSVDHGETKARFLALIRSLLAAPEKYRVMMVSDPNNAPLALFAFTASPSAKTEIVLFRTSKAAGTPTLSRSLISYILNLAGLTSAKEVAFIEQSIPDAFTSMLEEFGFFKKDGAVWTKLLLSGIWSVADFSSRFSVEASALGSPLPVHIDASSSPDELFRIERALWPLKIIGGGVPSFIIPIQPGWAMHLFDSGLAEGDLFGGRSDLMLSNENVYYRSARPGIVSAPGRILWYVSQSNQHPDSGALRACSMIDGVHLDTPKALYRRFRRLGVYEWRNLMETARSNVEQKIMAIQFSRTELFKAPIPFKEAREMLSRFASIQTTFQSPVAIPDEIFERLYQRARSVG